MVYFKLCIFYIYRFPMIPTCVCEFNVCYIHVWLFMVIETIIYLNQILIGLHWHGPWFIICHVSVDSHVSPSSSMFCYHNHVLSDVSSNEWIWESCSVVILMDASNLSFPYRFPWFSHIVYMICCRAFSPTDIQSASAGTLRWEAIVRQESKGVYVGDCPNSGFLKKGGSLRPWLSIWEWPSMTWMIWGYPPF